MTSKHALRQTLGAFATGVAIASAYDADGQPVGLTVNAFSSLSLEPPLILWCLRQHSGAAPIFQQAGHFAIQVLSRQQLALCRLFAGPGQDERKRAQFDQRRADAPLIGQAAAWLVCRNARQHAEGDHLIFIGEVLETRHHPERPPLIFWQGDFHQTHPLAILETTE
ncbi:flavin reductase family protein [Chromobacterium alticapitis]|uniref:Flavin reductase n=1 Tax=Chromobacterium alticapitis TaxID=2073169 RepID=A0A2S5DCC4_9NEIS|nr:flavin reductase family protein [Chromobacterium alticapitis]POZ60661.1 flavin reductase [Chromobacterium alticapitis]